MAAAARTHATDRGVDYRGLPLFAFGGAGPLHACGVAELLLSKSVIIPPQSSVLSAFGTLVTPVRLDLVRSDLSRVDQLQWERVDRIIGELEREGMAALQEAGCAAAGSANGDVTILIGADMRYVGQQHEVNVTFETDPRQARDGAALAARFESAYRALYGVNPSHVPIEIVTWRVTARGPLIKLHAPAQPHAVHGESKTTRLVHAWEEGQRAAVYDRARLAVGQHIFGPAIIEERETTTAIPPGWSAVIDAVGCIVAMKE
jgi:N-methylhydantoinase A